MISLSRNAIIFFLANLFLLSFFLDTWKNPNTTSRVLQVRSLLEQGNLHIDDYHEKSVDISFVNGHYYPDKAPMPTFIVFGVYKVLNGIGLLPDSSDESEDVIFRLASWLIGSLPLALVMLWLLQRLTSSGFDERWAMLLSSLPFYASMMFVYSGTFYSHVFAAALLIAAYKFIENETDFLQAGILTGLAFFSEYLVALFGLVWFVQIWIKSGFKKTFWFGLGLLPFVLAFFWYNYATTGQILETAYSHHVYYNMENGGFTWPNPYAMLHMLTSLLIYAPGLILLLFLLEGRKSNPNKVSQALLIPVILYFISVSAFKEWRGGWTFGPRYLIPIISLLMFAYFPMLKVQLMKRRPYFWIFMSVGIFMSFAAKFTVQYSIPSSVFNPVLEVFWEHMARGKWMDTSILPLQGIAPILTFLLCFLGFYSWVFLSTRTTPPTDD